MLYVVVGNENRLISTYHEYMERAVIYGAAMRGIIVVGSTSGWSDNSRYRKPGIEIIRHMMATDVDCQTAPFQQRHLLEDAQ